MTSYIFRWDKHKKQSQVLLFHRSPRANVHSYQGFYAPLSGVIRDSGTDPLTVAEREIVKATGLGIGKDLRICFAGQPFSQQGPDPERKWTVHPFGWSFITEDEKLVLGDEHDGWQWVDADKIMNGDTEELCVPGLHVSLQRVYLGPGGIFRNGDWLVSKGSQGYKAFMGSIDALKYNVTDGARILATDALKGLCELAKSFKQSILEKKSSNEYWYVLKVAAYHLIYSARPSMNAAIGTALLRALSEISLKLQAGELDPDDAISVLERHIEARNKITQQLSTVCDAFIHGELDRITEALKKSSDQKASLDLEIITISSSSTVKAACIHILTQSIPSDISVNLIFLDSRPASEGARMAASLVEELEKNGNFNIKDRFNVKICPESHASILLQPNPNKEYSVLRVILLGADRITPSGHVINKTGSAILAHLAHHKASPNTKVVILSEEDKIAGPERNMEDKFTEFINSTDVNNMTDEDEYDFAMLKQEEIDSMRHEHHEGSEVYESWPESTRNTLQPHLKEDSDRIKVQVENIYFEAVDGAHIDTYLTENGEIDRLHILNTSVQRSMVENDMFENLYH